MGISAPAAQEKPESGVRAAAPQATSQAILDDEQAELERQNAYQGIPMQAEQGGGLTQEDRRQLALRAQAGQLAIGADKIGNRIANFTPTFDVKKEPTQMEKSVQSFIEEQRTDANAIARRMLHSSQDEISKAKAADRAEFEKRLEGVDGYSRMMAGNSYEQSQDPYLRAASNLLLQAENRMKDTKKGDYHFGDYTKNTLRHLAESQEGIASFGLSNVADAIALTKTFNKVNEADAFDNPEEVLNPKELALYNAYTTVLATEIARKDDTHFVASAGKMSADMIQFMEEMLLQSGLWSGLNAAARRKMTQALSKKVVQKLTEKGVKRGLAKAGAGMIMNAAEVGANAAETTVTSLLLPRTYANMERNTIDVAENDNGIQFDGYKWKIGQFDVTDDPEAFLKAWGTQTKEMFTETGGTFRFFGNMIFKNPVARKAYRALGRTKFGHVLDAYGRKGIMKYSKAVAYDGGFGEWTEELEGAGWDYLFGDKDTFNKFFSKEQQLPMLISFSLPSAFGATFNAGMEGYYRKKYENAIAGLQTRLYQQGYDQNDVNEMLMSIKDNLYSSDVEKLPSTIQQMASTIVGADALTQRNEMVEEYNKLINKAERTEEDEHRISELYNTLVSDRAQEMVDLLTQLVGAETALASTNRQTEQERNASIERARQAERDYGERAIGENEFGAVYNWNNRTPQEAAQFLQDAQSGYLKGVFHRDEIGSGNVDMTWGHYKGGLMHMIEKHIIRYPDFNNVDEMMSILDDLISNGKVTKRESDGRYVVEKGNYMAIIAVDDNGEWVLTSFDTTKKDAPERSPEEQDEKRKELGLTTSSRPSETADADEVGTTFPQTESNGTNSDGKDTQNISDEQILEKKNAIKTKISSNYATITHNDGKLYSVKTPGENPRRGYVVGDGIVQVDDTDPENPRIINNGLITVKWENGDGTYTTQQVSTKDVELLAMPQPAEELIEFDTEWELETQLAYESAQQTYPAGTEVEITRGDGTTQPGSVVEVTQRGVKVSTVNPETGQADTTIIPIAATEQLLRPIAAPAVTETPTEQPQEVVTPDANTMSAERYGESMVEYMGDKAAAVGYLSAERDKAQAEITRLARQQVTRFDGMDDYKRQFDALKAQRIAAQERYNKLQNAISAANNYKTAEERAAEEARKAAMMAKREERKQTKAGIADNTSDGWFTEPNVIIGRSATITLADGKTYKGHYEIVPQSIILPSHNPFDNFKSTKGYPMVEGENINQRDYTSPEEVEKVNQIAQNYGGQAVRYVPSVVKQEMVGEDGKKKVKYIVMDGSGRMSAGHLAAANNTDAAYLQELHNNKGKFVPDAITDEQISKVDAHPRGIFVFDEDIPLTTSMQALFNAQETQRQSNTAAAAAYTRALTPQAVSEIINAIQPFENIDQFFSSNVATNGLVNKLIETGVMSQRDRASLFNGEKINDTGKDTLKNVMLGTVLDPEVIKLLGDEEGLKASILRAIPQIIDNKSLNEYALTEDINNAIRALYDMRNKGLSYTEYTLQLDLETGKPASADYRPFALLLAKAMNEGGVNDFRNKLSDYNNQARLLQGGQMNLLTGGVLSLTELKNQILEENGIEEREKAAVAEQLGTNVAGGATSDTQVQPAVPDNGQVEEQEQPTETPTDDNAHLSDNESAFVAPQMPLNDKLEYRLKVIEDEQGKEYADQIRNFVNARRADGEESVTFAVDRYFNVIGVYPSRIEAFKNKNAYDVETFKIEKDLAEKERNKNIGQIAADEHYEEYKQLKGNGDLSRLTDAELERLIDLCEEFTDPYDLRDMEETGTGEFISPDIDKQVADVVNTRNVAEEILNERKNAEKNAENDKIILSNEKKVVPLQGNQKEYSADGSSVVVSKDDYKTYLKPEAREVFARLALQRNTKYAHPEVAFIQYAVWDGVVIPLEELKGQEAIKAAQAKIDSYDGELEIDDAQVDTLANRLLDASHGSAVLNEKGKIDLVDGQENFTGDVKRERKAFIIIGRPAAGKSSVFANPLSAEHKARIIDSDVVKPWLEGFDNGDGAGYVQNASTKVANEALWRAAAKGENVIIPKIGGGSIVDELTIPLKAAGYTVELLYNEVVPDSSYMRAMARFAESGRYLSLNYLEGIDGKPTKTFDKYSTKYIGETINELPEEKVQDLRGRIEGLLGRLRSSVQPADVEQGGRGISGADIQALLESGELGGWRDAIVLRIGNQPLFDHYVQKNNDVRIGEQPKLVKEGTNEAKEQLLKQDNQNGTDSRRERSATEGVHREHRSEQSGLAGGNSTSPADVSGLRKELAGEKPQEQQEIARKWALENNALLHLLQDALKMGLQPFPGGDEHTNWLDAQNGVLYKMNNLMHAGDDISNLLERVSVFNELFPETSMTFVGLSDMGSFSNRVYPVYTQKYITNATFATTEQIDEYMRSKGFEPTGEEGEYGNSKYIVSDIKPKNVLATEDGLIAVVDAEIRPDSRARVAVSPESKFKVGDKIVYKGEHNGVITEVHADGTYDFEYPNDLGMRVEVVGIPADELQPISAPHPYNFEDWQVDGVWGAKEGQQVVPGIIDHFREYDWQVFDQDGTLQVGTPGDQYKDDEGNDVYRTFEQDNKGNWTYVGMHLKKEPKLYNTKKYGEETTDKESADSVTIKDEAEAIVAEAASIGQPERSAEPEERDGGSSVAEAVAGERGDVELTPDEQDEYVTTAQGAIDKIDKALDKVNGQLAVLGYYEADTDDELAFHESYGYLKSAEAKAVKDCDRLAKQLADDLGITLQSKRKVLAKANIAPAGGDISFHLPLEDGRYLYVHFGINPNRELYYKPDGIEESYVISDMYWRVENPNAGGMSRYGTNHNYGDFYGIYGTKFPTYDELLQDIKRDAKDYLPKVEAATKQERVKKAVEKAQRKKADKTRIPDSQQVLDLFADAVEDVNTAINQEPIKQSKNGDTEVRNDGKRKGRTQKAEPAGQPANEDGALGGSQRQTDEGTQPGGVDQSSEQHRVHDGERSRGTAAEPAAQDVKELPESEWKNVNNYHARSGEALAPTTPKARYDANMAAIRLLKQLQNEGRQATREEKDILAQFSGWGGLGEFFKGEPGTTYYARYGEKSPYQEIAEVLNEDELQAAQLSRNSAYYTPAPVINTLWNIAERLGFRGGNILEGSAGIGYILALMPSDISHRSDIQAVEIDDITAGILAQLYPDAKTYHSGFEKVNIPNNSVDLAITNVPFVTGLHVHDPKESDLSKRFGNIHDFCIAKNVRKLRQGGLGIFITSNGTLDNSKDLRRWLVNEGDADVIGAFRMNRETFGGTSATSDIIVVRKRVNGVKDPRAIDVLDTKVARIALQEQEEVWNRKTREYETPEPKEVKLVYNQYFVEHPESMGGVMGFGFEHGDTRFGGTTAGCYVDATVDQDNNLRNWVANMEKGEMQQVSAPTATGIHEKYEGNLPYGSLVLNSKGEICKVGHGEAIPVDGINSLKVKGHTKAEVLKDYNTLKSAVDETLAAQAKDITDDELKPYLKNLNAAYDGFVRKYGSLNGNTSLSFLRNDVQWASIAALENVKETLDVNGKKKIEVSKTDVFSKRVVGVQPEPKADNAKDGVILSVQQFGTIRPDKIAEWLGKSAEDVEREIIDSRLGFRDPATGNIQVRHEYLSGNVREKLAYAQEHNENGQYDTNIEELRKVLPIDIPAHLIEFNVGSTWIPQELYQEYLKEKYDVGNLKLSHVGSSWVSNEQSGYGNWSLHNERNRAEGVYSEKIGKQVYGHELMLAAMNNVPIVVSKVEKHYDGTTETIVDKAATAACSDKISQIKDDFVEWARGKMQQDEELAERVQKIYNDRFNSIVPMLGVDKMFLSPHLPNQNHKYTLYDHQQQAVVRATTQPVMLAHEVGTGKTITLISSAMEMRRLGTAKKPMIVVQNATTAQFVKEAKDLYPNAKILTVSERDRSKEGRQEFYAKIKYNDWDLIIVPQSVFDMIPDSEARMRDFIQEKIEEKMHAIEAAKDAGVDNKVITRMQKELEMLNEDLETNNMSGKRTSKKKEDKDAKKEAEQRANAAARAEAMLDRKTDDVADFDDMGIDALLIDEAHNYKHLGFATMMTRGVKGVDPSYSKRAAALYLKCQSVYERQGHRNVVFATGTPISNTAAEIWTFMKYLMPKEVLKENDIYYFDDFVHNFGKINEQLEFATNGKFKANNRFAQYGNVPELMRMWLTCADCVLTREVGQVNDKVPDIEGGKAQDIFLPQSPSLIDIMAAVRAKLDEYEHMSGKEKKENSHIPLTMYGIAKRAAIDPRLVSGNAADEPLSKTNKAVEETLRSLKDSEKYNGTVAIFCDSYQNKQTGFNLFNEMRDKLVKAGIPASKIAIIRSEMTDNAKQKIFDAVREGDIRVIMGSTQTLGTGVNIQTRLHTLIHMDAPDRPMDYTQRNGRIIRQGNMHKVWNIPVRVLRFGVEDSLDVTSYQRLKTKAGFIDSIMNGKSMIDNNLENRVIEDVEEGIFDNPVAMLSGSQFALLKSQAERDLRKWKARKEQHNIDQILIANRLRNNVTNIKREEENIKTYERRLEVIGQMIPDGKVTEYNIDGRVARTKEQLREVLKAVSADIQKEADALRKNSYATNNEKVVTTPMSFNGLQFNVDTRLTRKSQWKDGNYVISVDKSVRYGCPALSMADVPSQFVGLENIIEHIEDRVLSGDASRDHIADAKAHIERMKQESELMRQREGKKFEHQAELDKAQALVDEYTEKMKAEMAEKEAKYATQSAKAVDLGNMDAEDDDAPEISDVLDDIPDRYVMPRENVERRSDYVARIQTRMVEAMHEQYQRELDKAYGEEEKRMVLEDMVRVLMDGEDIPYVVTFDDDTTRKFLEFYGNYNDKTCNYIIDHLHDVKPRAICIDGEFMIFMGEYISDVDKMRTHLVHERQHAYNRTAEKFLSDIISNTNPEELAQFLFKIKGHDRYRKLADKYAKERGDGYAFYWLADEVAAHGIEICYDTPIGGDVVAEMRSLGITNENILNIIRDEFYRQKPNSEGRIYLRTGRYSSTGSDRTYTSGVRDTGRTGETVSGQGVSGLNSGSAQGSGRISQEKLVQLRDAAMQRAATRAKALTRRELADMADTSFSLRNSPAPKQTGIGYKVFFKGKDGKLYPPMVANPNGEDTPVGVWLDADSAPVVGTTKTGRPQVKAGGKGTQGGSGTLAYRPGWHLGEIPYALQFNRKDEKGNKTLFPKDFVWAEVEYAADVDYQKEANLEGYKGLDGKWSSKYNHALAGLKQVPENGFYHYRTNPNPETDPWIITGAIKVNRILSNEEVDAIVRAAGREPQRRQGERNERMDIIDAAAKSYMRAPNGKKSLLNAVQWTDVRTKNFKRWFGDWEKDQENASKVLDKNGEPMVVYHGTPKGDFTEFAEGRDIWTFNKRNLADQYRHSRGSLSVSMFPAKDSRIIDGFMNLRNPYEITVNGAHYRISKQKVEHDLYGKEYSYGDKPEWLTADEVVKMVHEHGGYDGVIFRDMYDNMFTTDKERGDIIVGFKPNQFKSASHNNGEFSDMPDFNASFGPEEPLSRHEAVTRGIVDAAKENREYMMQALKAVSTDIKAIRTALNMQADVDKNVVSSLLNLYMTLSRDVSAWSNGQMPFTAGQIFTQVRNAIGKEDITPYVNKIMDYVVNAQAKAAKTQFDKLRNTRIDKLNISGVVSQGKVAVQGQHALKALNDALAADLTVEQLEDMIADAMEKEDNATDESLRTEYKGRMIGYTIAAQHLERLRQLQQERQQLEDQLKDAAHMDHLSRQARKELADSIRQSIRDNQMEQADAYIHSARDLKEYIETQGERAKEFLDRITANREKIRGYAVADLGSVATNPNRLRTKQGVVRQIWDAIASPIRDLQSLLRMCAPKAINGEGYLYNHFMRGWTDAADTERKGIIDAMQTLDSKIAELTNGKYKTWEGAATAIASASRNDFAVEIKDGAREEEIPLNANNALYIYAVNKMEDGKMKLRAMNITDEDVQNLANSVRNKFGQELLDVVDWIQSDYFKQLRNRYNPTHEALFGAPMDAIDNYFPLVINPNSRQQNEDLGAEDNDAAKLLAGTSTGAIKRRSKNQLPLDIRNTDFFQQVIRHISQMEHWNAFAQWNRDANILFSDINFRNRVKNMDGTIYGKGDALYNYLKDAFKVAMGTYKPNADKFSTITLNMAKGVTAAKINFRVFTAVKQLASFPAFLTYMTDGVFVQSYIRNWMKPHETMTWAKETLPNFEKRISKRDLGDMRLMNRTTDWQLNKRILEWSQKYGMAANVFFDTLTCATGARAVYDSHRVDFINKGYSIEEAENRARQDAEQAFNTSQQSSEGAYLAPIQMDRNIITAALTVFRTAPIQYSRNFIYHARNIMNKFGKRDEQINFRKNQYINDGLTEEQAQHAAEYDYSKSMHADIVGMVVYGALLNILWRLAGQFPYLVFGDDDNKKKEIMKGAITGGAFVSPITGLLGGANIESMLDGYDGVSGIFRPELPFAQDVEKAEKLLKQDKYTEYASQALSVLMQSGTGFDPQTAADMIARSMTTINSEQDLDAAEAALRVTFALFSVPQAQYEQVLVDQVIDNRREYKDALKDYERYQLVHTAPLTWYLRDEEAEEKAMKAAKNHFDKLIKERTILKK